MAGTQVSFDGNSLQTANIVVSDIDHFAAPTKDVKLYTLAHANASTIPYVSYQSKTIRLAGKIFGSNITDLDSRLDTFKSYLLGTAKNLDIDYNGSTRRYTATINTTSIQRPQGLSYASFILEFVCTNPFGQDTSTTPAVTASGRTSANYADSYTFLGTAPYQRPVITVTFTAITGGTSATVSVGNNTNGQQISVTRTWASSDVLIIDTTQKTVTVNGVATNFSGAFPEFPPGAQTIGYADTFTTRTFNYSIVYTVLYM